MQLDHIVEFSVLAEIGNYSIAAEQLYTTEASLSRHVKKLEEELGKPLFKRTTRRVELTDFGQSILPFAKRFADLKKEMNAAVRDLTRITLNICIYGTLNHYMDIEGLFSSFIQANPNISINSVTAQSSPYGLLQSGACDVVFAPIMSGKEDSLYSHYHIFSDNATLILPKNHPLTREKDFSLAALKDAKFLTLSINSPMYNLCVQACEQAGFHPSIVMTMANGGAVIKMVESGVGVGFLLKHASISLHPHFPYSGDVFFTSPTPPVNVSLYMISNPKASSAVKLFTNFIQQKMGSSCEYLLS